MNPGGRDTRRSLRAPAKDALRVEFYEGLCRKTAAKYVNIVQEEYEDLLQILRLKCWRALESFDPAKSRVPVQNYVFSCVRNQIKDLLKREFAEDGSRRRQPDLYIEDIAPTQGDGAMSDHWSGPRQGFEMQYLREDEERAFAEVLSETPLIPSTLTGSEQRVLTCLYLEYGQAEIAEVLVISRREVARCVKAIKEKMADWKPSADIAEDEQQRPQEATVA